MRWLERVRSPATRAIRSAGPPEWQTIAALAVGVVIVVALAATVVPIEAWPWLGLLPLATTLGVALADGDGWLARAAMAWVAVEQRRRWQFPGRPPITPSESEAWIELHGPGASDLERAAVLLGVGNVGAASALLQGWSPADEVDRVRHARLLATARATAAGDGEILAAVRQVAGGLPGDERRYQLASAAWSQAWLDVAAGRPWRERFVAGVRDLGPFPVPAGPWLIGIALQQLLMPIVLAVGVVLLFLFTRF